MTESQPENAADPNSTKYSARRVELSLVLEFDADQYRGGDGEVNEELMRREALDYAAEAARDGGFDVEISLLDEVNE